jgi:hypothetical protein
MVSSEPFCHRRNTDGTIDSVCTCCFVTVGYPLKESELPEIEHRQTCDPDMLLHWKLLSRHQV